LKNSKIDNLILLVYSISPFWLQFFFFLHLTHAISGKWGVGKWGSGVMGDKMINIGDFT
jgi:heme/copper-type cytochrome/quinol oxidase subunit 4